MSNLFISTRSQSATPLAVPVGLKGTISDAPRGIERYLTGDFLRGTVLGQDDQNRLLVRTDLGVLKITTQTPLPPGTEVTLELRQAGARIQVLILQATPNDPANPTGALKEPSIIPPLQGSAGQRLPLPDSIQQGQTIKAIIQAPSLSGISSILPELSGRLVSGSELNVRVVSIGLPPNAALSATTNNQQTIAPDRPPAAVPTPATPPAQPPQAARQGTSSPVPPNPTPPNPELTNPAPVTSSRPTPAQPAFLANTTPNVPAGPTQQTVNPGVPVQSPTVKGEISQTKLDQPVTRPHVPESRIGAREIGSKEIANILRSDGGKVDLPRVHRLLATSAPIQPAASQVEPDILNLSIKQLSAISPRTAGSNGEVNLRITGQITGTSGTGQPIMQTVLGTLTLDLPSPIPKGSSVALEVSQPSPTSLPAPAPQLGSLDALAPKSESAAVIQIDGAKLPIPEIGRNLGPSLLLFLSVLKGGRVAEWLSGTPIPTLSSAQSATNEPRMGPENTPFIRTVENSSGEWRLIYLPFLHMGVEDHIRLFLRQRKSAASKSGEDNKSKRFVVEANVPRLNNIQLDCFIAPERFDLIFRSERPLSTRERGHISKIFDEALRFEDWQGQISFLELAGKFMGDELEDMGELLV